MTKNNEKNSMKRSIFSLSLILFNLSLATSQSFIHYTTTEAQPWQQARASLSGKAKQEPLLTITGEEHGREFRAWGTCFNELDLDALELLKPEEQEEVMRRLFDPEGDLKFTRGRLTMNANDYSRAWYSCDTVAGDFQLKYFNIEHDKQNVIRLIRKAQKYQPQMTFWILHLELHSLRPGQESLGLEAERIDSSKVGRPVAPLHPRVLCREALLEPCHTRKLHAGLRVS